jgi:hypothetical protein
VYLRDIVDLSDSRENPELEGRKMTWGKEMDGSCFARWELRGFAFENYVNFHVFLLLVP